MQKDFMFFPYPNKYFAGKKGVYAKNVTVMFLLSTSSDYANNASQASI